MTKPPRLKRRFQIHLSTAIVMMFVAGGIIWASQPILMTLIDFETNRRYIRNFYGWPFRAISENVVLTHDLPIALDVITAMTILVSVYFLCEWLIRRRSARKEA